MSICSSLFSILSSGCYHVMLGLISTFFWSNVIIFRENAIINDFKELDKILATIGLVTFTIGLSKVKSITKRQSRIIIITAILGVLINAYMLLIKCDEYDCWISKFLKISEF